MSCKNEIWSIEFCKSSMSVFLNGKKILEEATIVALNEKGRFVAAGNKALLDEKKYATTKIPITYGCVIDFECAVYYFTTIFRERLKKRNRVQSITAIIPYELANIEERAIEEVLEYVSKNIVIIYPSNNNDFLHKDIQDASRTKANIIANEIVENVRMIGIALIVASLYISMFLIYHHNDRKTVAEIEWGQSCYDDGVISGNYNLDFQRIYYENWMCKNVDQYYKFQIKRNTYDEELNFIKWRSEHQFDDSVLLKSAFIEVEHNENLLKEEVNRIRMYRAKEDLLLQMKYSILFAIMLTVIGRYLIKGIRWVVSNKS